MMIIVRTYIGANSAYHLVLSMDEVATSGAVASDTFYVLLPRIGIPLAALGVMCSTFGATQSNMRVAADVLRDGPGRPVASPPLQRARGLCDARKCRAAAGCVGIGPDLRGVRRKIPRGVPCADRFRDLRRVHFFYAMAVASVFVLRVRRPDWPRPYRTWAQFWTPAIYLLAFLAVLRLSWSINGSSRWPALF